MKIHKFYKNGFLIQKVKEYPMNYSGVEGDVWFLDEYSYPQHKDEMKKIYHEYDEKICADNEGLECCTDIDFMKKYMKICDKMEINYNVLFCETLVSTPIFKNDLDICKEDFIFLGYDYAYLGGGFYSCILNDLCFKRFDDFSSIKLNSNGLFDKLQEVREFIKMRKKLSTTNKLAFELGEFTIYKVWKMYNS